MATTNLTPDGKRALRDGEFIVDCTRARTLFENSALSPKEEAAAQAANLTRGVLRRIIGRDGNHDWSVVTTPSAAAFADACGGQLGDIAWSQESRPGLSLRDADVEDYVQRFRDVLVAGLGPYVPLSVKYRESSAAMADIVECLRKNSNVEIIGPSGCGKSHLLTHLAISSGQSGLVPVLIRARQFTSDLPKLLDRIVNTASKLRYGQLLKASAEKKKRSILIVDALNECPPELVPELIAALQRIRINDNIPIAFSSQARADLPPSLIGEVFEISAPTDEEKRQLLRAHLTQEIVLPSDLSHIVASAHDAMILAEVINNSDARVSRYALYESFVRKRLGGRTNAAPAYRVLSDLAAEMRTQFVYSVPESILHAVTGRLAVTGADEGKTLEIIAQSGIVQSVAGRVSFRHELLQNFMATEKLLLDYPNAELLSQALNRPINLELQEFALGSASSSSVAERAISQISLPKVLIACAEGKCGPIARDAVENRCGTSIEKFTNYICNVSFDFLPGEEAKRGSTPIDADITGCAPFNEEDKLYLTVAAGADGQLLDKLLTAIRRIDLKIESERVRLKAKYPEKKFAWRAALFTALYCFPTSGEIGALRTALQNARMGRIWRKDLARYNKIVSCLANFNSLLPGQLYYLIEELHGLSPDSIQSLPPFLYDLVDRSWRLGIYHLRLSTSHLIYMTARKMTDGDRGRFVDLANSWLGDDPFLNSIVIDVLKALDGLESPITVEEAVEQFRRVLALPESSETYDLALGMYTHTFDHPFDVIYAEAYTGLKEQEKTTLLERAIKSVSSDSMFCSFLLLEIGKNPTPVMTDSLEKIALYPSLKNFSHQDSVSAFVSAIASLAKLQVKLPSISAQENSVAQAWSAARQIVYAFFTCGNLDDFRMKSNEYWMTLEQLHGIDIPMRLLDRMTFAIDEERNRFLDWSKPFLISLARKALGNPEDMLIGFPTGFGIKELKAAHIQFALTVIETAGDRSDLAKLAPLIESTEHGTTALRAARTIEGRV